MTPVRSSSEAEPRYVQHLWHKIQLGSSQVVCNSSSKDRPYESCLNGNIGCFTHQFSIVGPDVAKVCLGEPRATRFSLLSIILQVPSSNKNFSTTKECITTVRPNLESSKIVQQKPEQQQQRNNNFLSWWKFVRLLVWKLSRPLPHQHTTWHCCQVTTLPHLWTLDQPSAEPESYLDVKAAEEWRALLQQMNLFQMTHSNH